MRLTAIATVVALLVVAPATAQTQAPAENPYGLDPYTPSDAEFLRKYGSILTAQTPLLELRKLDPYKPSHAALLRDLGGGIPLWALWYPPTPGPLTPFATTGDYTLAPGRNLFVLLMAQPPAAEPATSPAAPAPESGPRAIATALRPESNDGVWIVFNGQRWINAGPAVVFDESQFTRVGEHGGFPVFKRTSGDQDVIYLPTRQGVVAPYRLKP